MNVSSEQSWIKGLERELKDALDRQAATSDILEVIRSSPADAEPVFDAIVNAGLKLFPDATVSIALQKGKELHVAAIAGPDPAGVEAWRNRFPSLLQPDTIHGFVILNGQLVDIPDVAAQQEVFPGGAGNFLASGYRAVTMIPIAHGKTAIGALALLRLKTGKLSKEQFSLLQTFAAQANIAIENVHQFREIQARLERERASRAILQVISQSRDNERPVFEVILDSAAQLCDAPLAYIRLLDETGTGLVLAAHHGTSAEFIAATRAAPLSLDVSLSDTARAFIEKRTIHIEDLAAGPLYRERQPNRLHAVESEGMRTLLIVPLMSEGTGLGTLSLYRREVAPFTEDQIALVETFASQANIAIENVRQFRALEALNAELEERVNDQVAELERMGRLKRFLPPAVADTVVSSGSEDVLSSHRSLLGVLFCDIRGFTAFCETAEPEETIEVLQTYHEEMGKLINDHGAGVDHRMGDGIMVLFNDPIPCDDPAGDAVKLAIAMRARMAELCRNWKRMGYRLGFGVGVSLGYATVGLVGFEGRFEYTASGTAVNLASRLCDEAEDGEILLSPKASIAVEDTFLIETRGELTLKGLREPFEVFRLAASA